jgi:hypothetical protein
VEWQDAKIPSAADVAEEWQSVQHRQYLRSTVPWSEIRDISITEALPGSGTIAGHQEWR